MKKSSPQAIRLYHALRKIGIKCQLEAWDGYKHVDISIPWAQMDIEIDGFQHYVNPRQIESDLMRSYYSAINDDFLTMRIPNAAIDADVNAVAAGIRIVARKRYFEELNREPSFLTKIKKLLTRWFSNY